MAQSRVVVILASESDAQFAAPIKQVLDKFAIRNELRVASAHKDSEQLIKIIAEYEKLDEGIVYITVAGMSNALSGFVDFKTRHPVIACPHLEEKFGLVDVYSSLRMPRGVAPLVTLNPESAALAAAKILGETHKEFAEKIRRFQEEINAKNKQADGRLRGS